MRASIELKNLDSHFAVLALAGLFLGACQGSQGESAAATSHAATCADPIPLTGATTLDKQTTAGASDAVSADDSSCLGFATHGPEQVYKVTVPSSGQTKLQVSVTPGQSPGPDAYDPVIYLTQTCAAQPTCIAPGQDIHGGGGSEAAVYTNTSGQPQDLFVVVDGYDFQPSGGGYQLSAKLTSP